VVEPEELTSALSKTTEVGPEDPEVVVLSWVEADDGIEPHEVDDYFDDEGLMSFSDEERDRAEPGTRIGSVPRWVQSANESPPKPWKFVMQIVCNHTLDSGNDVEGSNFGGDGTAYVVLQRKGAERPEGLMFWQCG
jgi:hypothetical protein